MSWYQVLAPSHTSARLTAGFNAGRKINQLQISVNQPNCVCPQLILNLKQKNTETIQKVNRAHSNGQTSSLRFG